MVVCLVIFFMKQVCLCPKKVEKHCTRPIPCSGKIFFFFISNIQFFKMIYNKKTFNLSFIVAAQLHILTLLEHVKEQQMAIAAAVNNLAARLGTEAPVAEMPKDISIPLTTVPEVEEFEEWLKDSGNS
ncbi:hypothetical protein XENTR_v10013329 [Xenopus tropicalis]|nr:hypothetical protein XENTR_v10013329 [Xenopus tropicalis]